MKRLSADQTDRRAHRLFAVCIAVHLVLDFAMIGNAWFADEYQLVFGIALPFSQCSLIAIWAASSRGNLALRFLGPPVTTIFCWYVLGRLLVWGAREPAAVAWGLALAVQVLVVFVAYLLYQICRYVLARSAVGRTADGLTFNLRTLMLWSAAIAAVLGFIQYGRDHWQWDHTVGGWEYIHAMPIIGAFNAILAVLYLWALANGSWQARSIKVALAIMLSALMGYALPKVLDLTSVTHGMETRESLILAATQSLILFLSLIVAMVANSLRTRSIDEILPSAA